MGLREVLVAIRFLDWHPPISYPTAFILRCKAPLRVSIWQNSPFPCLWTRPVRFLLATLPEKSLKLCKLTCCPSSLGGGTASAVAMPSHCIFPGLFLPHSHQPGLVPPNKSLEPLTLAWAVFPRQCYFFSSRPQQHISYNERVDFEVPESPIFFTYTFFLLIS